MNSFHINFNKKTDDKNGCSKCKMDCLETMFDKDGTIEDGLRTSCNFCTNQYQYKKREKINLRERKRLTLDVNYRLIKNTRRKIRRVLNGKSKSFSTRGILGIGINLYKKWIEF